MAFKDPGSSEGYPGPENEAKENSRTVGTLKVKMQHIFLVLEAVHSETFTKICPRPLVISYYQW